MTNFSFVLFILLVGFLPGKLRLLEISNIQNEIETRAAAFYDMYQLVSHMPSIGETNSMNDNSYSSKIYFSDMPECNEIYCQAFLKKKS